LLDGYLDHALANAGLAEQVAGVVEWHINADEPATLDYNDYNQSALYNADPYRASDHDPVIVGLDLEAPLGTRIYLPVVVKSSP
jgi:predicted extracellular nuclease